MHVFRHIGLVLWTLGNHIITSNESPFIATRQTLSQDFVQEGPTWRELKVLPTKNRKFLGFRPLFFHEPRKSIPVFSNYFILF